MIQVGNREIPARSYISSFGFPGCRSAKAVGKLSGGERNRLNLAKNGHEWWKLIIIRRTDK